MPKLQYPEYANTLDRAQIEIWSGRYKLGLITLKKVKDGDASQIAVLKATALAETGRRRQALQVLSDPAVAKDAHVQIHRANLLADMGKLNDALAISRQLLKQHPDSIAGHYQLGRISELAGDYDTARDAYKWFVDDPQHFLDGDAGHDSHRQRRGSDFHWPGAGSLGDAQRRVSNQ